jgi:hypothetical protein
MNDPKKSIPAWSYTVAFGLVLLVVGVDLIRRQDNEWETVYLPAAARLSAGDDLYRRENGYLYPPFMAWASLPFLKMSHAGERIVWVVLNLAALVFVLRGAWNLAGRPTGALAVLGVACGVFYLHNCLAHQQTDVFIAALLTAGCLLLQRGRSCSASVGFGLAAAMKCTALLWLPYLLWRRRPVAAVCLAAVALGANLLPDLVSRPESGRTWLGEYVVRYLRPLTEANHVPGSWGSEVLYNQSLAGAGQRWLLTRPEWSADDVTVVRVDSSVPPMRLRGVVHGAELILVIIAIWVCGRPWSPAPPESAVGEYGVVLLLMLLLSPMSSMAHFGTLVIPGLFLAQTANRSRSVLLTCLLAGSAALALTANKDLLGGRLYTVALWSGSVMWNTLFLLAGCFVALRETAIEARAADSPPGADRAAA